MLPPWLDVWWGNFGNEFSPHVCSVRERDEIIGIAPLMVQGEKAFFIGGSDVCDYLDFVVDPRKAQEFFRALIKHLREQGITCLDLGPVRNDSTAFTDLVGVAKSLACDVSCDLEDVSLEMELPSTWDAFVGTLSGKDRHEIRRKLRRLGEAGHMEYRLVEDVNGIRTEMDIFLELFGSNRPDKAAFMTGRMASFFRSLAEALAEMDILKLYFLDLDGAPAAVVMCFDYQFTMYLYNNGYDQRFSSLSVGLLSKVLNIKASIELGKKKYDFLKGDEDYKGRLGGQTVPLYRCRVKLG
jgi:CelD/BcsL family acetyltransferase involved in cellulose biosynthesis